MLFLQRMRLRTRLVVGFLCCALIAVLSVVAVDLALRQIQQNIAVSTQEIGQTISEQVKQSQRLSGLRSLAGRILSAHTAADLATVERDSSSLGAGDEAERRDVSSLHARKSEYFAARGQFEQRAWAIRQELTAVNKIAAELADDAEYEATLRLQGAVAALKLHAGKSMEQTEKALNTASASTERALQSIHAALGLRTHCLEIGSLIKDVLLSGDGAWVDYTQGTADTLLSMAKAEVARLPEKEVARQFMDSLGELDAGIRSILKAKKQALSGRGAAGEITARMVKDLDAALDAIARVALEIVDETEYDSTIAIQDSISSVKELLTESQQKTAGELETVSSSSLKALSVMKSSLMLRAQCFELEAQVLSVLVASDPAVVDFAHTSAQAVLKNALTTLGDSTAGALVAARLGPLETAIKDVIQAKKETLTSEAELGLASARLTKDLGELDLAMLLQASHMRQGVDARMRDGHVLAVRSRYALLIVGLCNFVLALVVGLLIAGSVTRPIRGMVRVFQEMAQGDLTLHVGVGETDKDELSQMARAVNEAVCNMHQALKAVIRSSQDLTSSSDGLMDVSQRMATSAEQNSTKAETVSASATQISESVGSIACGVEELGSCISEISANAANAAEFATSAVEVAHDTGISISKLATSVSEIGEVVDFITSIAERTNLLALNAAIESARAGDAGKGFAVVAHEVKELARETAKATEAICQKISGIQENTREAISATGSITHTVGQISSLQNTIATAVEEQATTTQSIGRDIHDASLGSSEIARNISGLALVATEMSSVAKETRTAADSLVQVSAELGRLVSRFRC